METLLQECSKKFGAPERSFSFRLRNYLLQNPPLWVKSDQIQNVYNNRLALLRRGRLVWGAIIHSNEFLAEPTLGDATALALWSEDEKLGQDPDALRLLARRLRNVSLEDEEMQEVAAFAHDPTRRAFQVRVPESFAPNTFITTLMVIRSHLPTGFLSSSVLPLLVLPEENPCAFILPGVFWPDELADR